MMFKLGYDYLVTAFNLPACPPLQMSQLTARTQKSVVQEDDRLIVSYPQSAISIASNWYEQLCFALKYEGLNLAVIKALFAHLDKDEITHAVVKQPTSRYARQSLLYEWLTQETLPIADLKMGNYVPLVNDTLQIARPIEHATRLKRYRLLNNLIGSATFCPLIRLTPRLQQQTPQRLQEKCQRLFQAYPQEILLRATDYLYLKETKSSFAIERETPDQRRIESFIALLRSLSQQDIATQEGLCQIQNVIVDPRYQQGTWRKTQVYVGQTITPIYQKVHYIAPKPTDIESLMQDWMTLAQEWLTQKTLNPIVVAAILSFTFVFLHPFDDGNGRTHRFIIHYVLDQLGFTPGNTLFPVSAVLLKDQARYDKMLESVSRPVMTQVDYDMTERGEVHVNNATIDLYRYLDLTPIVESFYTILEETIDLDWKQELEYLAHYDQLRKAMREIVDLPEQKANQLILFIRQNNGILSKAKRAYFAELTDAEIAQFEQVLATHLPPDGRSAPC